NLGGYLFGWYGGVGLTFLPIFHEDFSFKSNFSIYEQAYADFEISSSNTFKFKGRKFEGFSYEYGYIHEFEKYPGLSGKITKETKFSYNSQGVLYNYHTESKYYEKTTGDYELNRKTILDYSIDSYDKDLVVGYFWLYGLSGILISGLLVVYWRRGKSKKSIIL
ncbi:MAG: hypothetical protein ACTSSG_11440, partial [Candidatus Heimdallarchaeaceae archaeon]